jgi:PAS domain S-box-containing protein
MTEAKTDHKAAATPRGPSFPRRGRSATRRLALMVAAATIGFAVLGSLLAVQIQSHARATVVSDATFQAKLAARSVDDALNLARTTLAATAAGLPVQQLLATPSECQLRFTGLGPFPRGHLDVVLNDGKVICSSLAVHGAPPRATHAGAAWLTRPAPAAQPALWPPSVDRLTGVEAVTVTTPMSGRDGKLVARLVLQLEVPPLAQQLVTTYAGPRGFAFTVRSEGRALSGTGTAAAPAEDAPRVTGTAAVTALPWSIEAGIDETTALEGSRAVIVKGTALGVGVLGLLLIVLVLVNRQIARPLDRLAATEAGLRLSEERLRSLLDGAPDYAIIMLDRDGRVVSWSASAHLLEGYTEQEILGRHYDGFFTQDDVLIGRPAQILGEAARNGRKEDEGLRVREDGSRYWAQSVVTARLDGDGEVRGYVVVSHDATARHEAELTISRMNAELEHRVEERTEQLRRQATKLRAANAELEAFSYSVSHDLRGPLRAIGGFAYILGNSYADQLPPGARQYTDRIIRGAETLSHMVDALLGLSATQRAAVHPTVLDMTALARSVWEDLESDIGDRSIDFVLPQLPPAHGDPHLIRQVFVNLLANAVKYTRRREHTTIELGSLSDPSGTIWFVRDNGAGFDMRQSDNLFQAFRRLHSEEDFPGTGIGLASVQRIITRHDGRIWAEGEPDRGATFYFTLGPPLESIVNPQTGGLSTRPAIDVARPAEAFAP